MSATSKLEEVERRSPGRPRSDESRQAILDSTLELLKDVGFDGLSIEAIAARASVGKATVYRWWKNKAELVVEAFLATAGSELRFDAHEPIEAALRSQMLRVAKIFSGEMGTVIAAVIGAGQSEPEMLEAFHDGWIEPRRTEARKLLQQAMDSGRLRDDIPPDTVLDVLYGALYFRLLIRKRPLDKAFVESIANIVMSGSSRRKKSCTPVQQ
jgi:AcrR family transcriptional regulator